MPKPDAGPAPAAAPELADGAVHPDLVVQAGDSLIVHDPSPPTSIGFALGNVCTGPARLTGAGQTTDAVGQASLRFPGGRHRYEIRCLERPEVVARSGYVSVLRDAGTRQLPSFAPTANVITDGRRYTVMYQDRLPEVTLSWTSAPRADGYALEIDGRTLPTKAPTHKFAALSSGTHLVAFSAATTPPRRSRTTTIEVVLDTQAPAARVSEPRPGFEPAASVKVAGQALPGWTVSVEGEPIAQDAQRRFSAEHAGNGVIPIAFSHPTHGTHYYLRRPKAPAP
jgi:hypothetical protein